MSWEPKKTAVSALGLPRDVILGDVLISFVGRSQVNVENYRSIHKEKDDFDVDIQACSAMDCTGLIPSLPQDEAEKEAYEDLYPYVTKAVSSDKE